MEKNRYLAYIVIVSKRAMNDKQKENENSNVHSQSETNKINITL